MANICTNLFFCKTDNKANYQAIINFIEEKFEFDYINEDEDNHFFESEFGSKWSFPEQEFTTLMSTLEPDTTLYLRILSHELCCEYASFRIYKNQTWEIQF